MLKINQSSFFLFFYLFIIQYYWLIQDTIRQLFLNMNPCTCLKNQSEKAYSEHRAFHQVELKHLYLKYGVRSLHLNNII